MLAILAGCCRSDPAAGEAAASNTQSEIDVFEALLRHVHSSYVSDPKTTYRKYFVLIRSEDPSDELVSRFADLDPGFVKGSGFPSAPRGEAFLFEITDIIWIDALTAEVFMKHWTLGANAYTLSKKSGEWLVIKTRMKSIQ